MITHAIFDLDGLLLDTESINEQVNRAIAHRYDRPFDPDLKFQVAGRDAITSATILVTALDLPIDAATFLQERRALIATWQPTAAPLPGAVALTTHLHRWGVGLAIATSSTQGPFAWKMAPHQAWLCQFDQVVLRDDPAVSAGKPARDLFQVAADRLGADSAQCLVFEDSVAGIQAAQTAGMRAIAIPPRDSDPRQHPQQYAGAVCVLRSLTEFDPTRWGWPAIAPDHD
jgi:pseudouridine-5'-monophosphatase